MNDEKYCGHGHHRVTVKAIRNGDEDQLVSMQTKATTRTSMFLKDGTTEICKSDLNAFQEKEFFDHAWSRLKSDIDKAVKAGAYNYSDIRNIIF
jgi:hypothetical protein